MESRALTAQGLDGARGNISDRMDPCASRDSDALAGFTRPDFHRRFPSPGHRFEPCLPGAGEGAQVSRMLRIHEECALTFLIAIVAVKARWRICA